MGALPIRFNVMTTQQHDQNMSLSTLGLGLTFKQLVLSVTVLAMTFPCIATFVILGKELGPRDMVKSVAIMLVTTLLVGPGLNLVL